MSCGNISGTNSISRGVQSNTAFNNRAGHQKSKVCMTKFTHFLSKAVDILPEHTDNETTSRVAFHLMERELENEKKLEVLELKKDNEKTVLELKKDNEKTVLELKKDNEKKLEVLELKKDNEKTVLELKKDNELELQKMKLRQSNAYHSKQLSAVVQRCLSVCTHTS